MADGRIISYTDLFQKRILAFPFPVSQIGYLRSLDREIVRTQNYGHLEFCFRLHSEGEREAVDLLDGKYYRTPFPHLFIKPPEMFHSFRIAAARRALYLQYPVETVPHFLACGISFRTPGIPFEITGEIEELIGELRSLIGIAHRRGSAERIDLGAFRLIELVLLQKNKTEDSGEKEKIHEIAVYLSRNFSRNPDFDALCRKFAISRRSFFRGWSRLYPMSPLEYVIHQRMQEAMRLLETSDRSVHEIAEITGYGNAAYFGAVFRRKYNCSPGRYRAMLRANSGRNL